MIKDYSNKKKANSVLVYVKNESIENELQRREVLQVVNDFYELPEGNMVNNNSWRNAGRDTALETAIPLEELKDDLKELEPYLKGEKQIREDVDNSDNENPTDKFISFQGYDEILQLLNSISNKQVTQFEEIKSLLNNNNISSEEQPECEDLKAEIEQLKEENRKLKENQSSEIDLNEYVLKDEYEELKAKYEQLKEEKQPSDVDLSEYVSKEEYDKVNEKYNKAVKRVKEQIQPNYEKLQKENEDLKDKLEKAKNGEIDNIEEEDELDVFDEVINKTMTSNLNKVNTNNKDEDDSCDFDVYEFLNMKESELGNNNITDDNQTNTNDEDMLFDIDDVYNI